ncbi:MAG: sulfatase [Acetobacteraceae bacterium]
MKILYIDIDSLRPDHLGCYGYARATSPTIDRLASEGTRFENVMTSDSPCLPSRTALWSGQFGFHTGVVGHGGSAAAPFPEGRRRDFRDSFYKNGWMTALRETGHHTATISSFGERHSAWHWYAGFNDIINPGGLGIERADAVVPLAIEWIARHAWRTPNWFLHVNLWDVHTPYRTPEDFRPSFLSDAPAGWIDAAMLERFRSGFGPHSAREACGYDATCDPHYPCAPGPVADLGDVRAWIDGYDRSLRFADDWIGRLVEALAREGVLEETMIIVSADHGENLGELNIWGDHQTADRMTCRVPLIVKWPGGSAGQVDRAWHYPFDWAATLIELAGGKVPETWDGISFAGAMGAGRERGRDFLVTTHGAWSCQRGVHFTEDGRPWQMLVTYHDGYKDLPPLMLFDALADPHETRNVAASEPDLVGRASALLIEWQRQMMESGASNADPLMTVMREGGPFHCRGMLPAYLERLRRTGREEQARALERRHPEESRRRVMSCGRAATAEGEDESTE